MAVYPACFPGGSDMDNIFFWFNYKFNQHRVSVHAAHVAFFILVSIFPFLMFFISLLQYTPLNEEIIASVFQDVIPGHLSDTVISWLQETYRASNSTILSATVIAALWTGSKGLFGIVYEMDQIYEVKKKRNLFICRLQSIFYTIVFTLMIITSLLLLVYGNQILQLVNHYFPLFREVTLIVFLLRSCISFLVFVIYFLFLYRFIPKHQTRFRDELPGASLAAFLWIAFSYLYSIYIDTFNTLSSAYGSLTSIVLLMLWLYFCILFIFIGAMLNQYLKEHNGRLHLRSSIREILSLVRSFLENKK